MPMLGRDPKPSDPEKSEPHQPDHLIDPALRDNNNVPPTKEDSVDTTTTSDSDSKSMRQPLHMSSPHHRTYSNRLPSPPPPIATMSNSPSPSVSIDRSSNSTPHIRRSPPNLQQQQPSMYPPSYDQRHHYAQRGDPIPHPYSYPHFEQQQQQQQQQQRYEHHHTQHPHSQHPDPHSQYHTQPYFSVPTMAHPQQPQQPQMRDNYGRQYPPISQTPVTIVHTDDAATKLTDGIRRRCFNCCTTDTSTWRRSNLSPGKVLCNKCGLFERTHSRPRPDQFPHKRGPLAVSVSRGRTPPGNHLPPISNLPGSYQYHHAQLTPLNAGDYHQNPLPGLQTWQNNSGTTSNNPNNGTGSHNGSANHGVSPSEPTNVSGNGNGVSGNGGGNGNSTGGGASAQNMAPLLIPRRQTLDSPRMTSSASSISRSGRPFDELSSNAAIPSNTSGSASAATAGGDSSRPHSQPPTPPSRSSTVHPSAVGVKPHDGGGSSAGHSPPPASVNSSARDQA